MGCEGGRGRGGPRRASRGCDEPVALAPEQALKPAQRMCEFLALRLAFGNPSASNLHKAALSGSSGSSSSAERVSLAMKMI